MVPLNRNIIVVCKCMTQKPIAISVIAAVGVAGILTLSVLAAISSTNRAFAQKPTELTVGMSPDTRGKSQYYATGKLTSEGKGVGGATITFDWIGNGVLTAGVEMTSNIKTNSDGTYRGYIQSLSPGSWHALPLEGVKANYAGDSEHMPAHSVPFILKG